MYRDKVRKYIYSYIAIEISRMSKYFDAVFQLDRMKDDDQTLFDQVNSGVKIQIKMCEIEKNKSKIEENWTINRKPLCSVVSTPNE